MSNNVLVQLSRLEQKIDPILFAYNDDENDKSKPSLITKVGVPVAGVAAAGTGASYLRGRMASGWGPTKTGAAGIGETIGTGAGMLAKDATGAAGALKTGAMSAFDKLKASFAKGAKNVVAAQTKVRLIQLSSKLDGIIQFKKDEEEGERPGRKTVAGGVATAGVAGAGYFGHKKVMNRYSPTAKGSAKVAYRNMGREVKGKVAEAKGKARTAWNKSDMKYEGTKAYRNIEEAAHAAHAKAKEIHGAGMERAGKAIEHAHRRVEVEAGALARRVKRAISK